MMNLSYSIYIVASDEIFGCSIHSIWKNFLTPHLSRKGGLKSIIVNNSICIVLLANLIFEKKRN